MLDFFLVSFIGFMVITLIDRVWFRIDYKKAEKGLEVLEHYHYGIVLLAILPFVMIHSQLLAFGFFGAGAAFIYHESKQKNFFAHHSTHAKNSTIIGIILCVIAITLYLYSWGVLV